MSTMFGGSQPDLSNDQSQAGGVSFDIESKFKKKNKKPKAKAYKEDDIEENYLQNLFDDTNIKNGIIGEKNVGGGASKNDIR